MNIKLFKITFLILSLMCLTLATVSCKEDSKIDINTDIESGQGDADEKNGLIDIIKDGICEYGIIYPADSEPAIDSAVTLFASRFEQITGIPLPVSRQEAGEEFFSHKIIFGKIDNPDVKKVYEELRYYDYSVSVSGSNIIVAAHTSLGYMKAVNYIESTVLSSTVNDGNGVDLTMKVTEYKNSTHTSYPINSWTVHGTDLLKYRIVYASDEILDEITKLRDDIAKACGAYLDIVKDTESEPQKNEILIGSTNRAESALCADPSPLHFYAKACGTKLVIKSGGVYSASRMLAPLFTAMTSVPDGKIAMAEGYVCEGDLFDDPLDSSYADGTDIRIMSCNILAELESWSQVSEHYPYLPVRMREELLFAALDYYRPTIVGFQELTSDWYRAIEENYHAYDNWELLKFDNPNRADDEYVFSTVMYRSDLYTLMDSGMSFYSAHNNGRARCYTWAVLKSITTGQEFCFVSTHWDGSGKPNAALQANELSEFVNSMRMRMPVFTTGDFNSNENSPELKQFFEDCESVDAKYAALEQVNNVGSWHNFLKDDLSWGSCDHITATKDVTVLKFQTLYKNGLIYASDHCWLIADIRFDDK